MKRSDLSPILLVEESGEPSLSEFSIVLTTASNPDVVKKLIDQALETGLAACVQALPITSHYRWQGKIENGSETLLLFKTKTKDYQLLEEMIRAHHDYQLPEILQLPISAGFGPYLNWIRDETR